MCTLYSSRDAQPASRTLARLAPTHLVAGITAGRFNLVTQCVNYSQVPTVGSSEPNLKAVCSLCFFHLESVQSASTQLEHWLPLPCTQCTSTVCCHAGGGYILGSCQYQLSTAAATAAAAGLTIICPDYRLAPEHPFPAGLNDVLNVYKALINQEGYSPKNIVLLGDSAGGGLVPAMAAQLQREGVALPAALGMFSPFTDLRNAQRSDTVKTLIGVDPFIGVPDPGKPYSELESLGSVYVGNNATLLDDPLASPVLADYAALFPGGSLPPTLIQVGLRQVLLSDAIRLYHKMQAAAPAPGHVVISPYEGMWHVFQTYGNVPEAAAASKEMADYFTRALNGKICK